MARYLFTVWPFPGHINPNVAVALALRSRGHDVAFYTGAMTHTTFDELGIPHFPIRHIDEAAVYGRHGLFQNDEDVGRIQSLAAWWRTKSMVQDFLIGTIPGQFADIEPILDEWQPDVLVCDPIMWAPFLILHEKHSIPVAVFSLWTGSMLSGSDAPPWGRGLPPPTTAVRRTRAELERVVARRLIRGFQERVNAERARHGLASISRWVNDYAGTMPLYLVQSVRELDYNRHPSRPTVHYVGRCAWDRPATQPPPQWLHELPHDRPLVYVTEGTIHGKRPRLLQAAARGLADLPVHVVMTLNADRNPSDVGLAPLAPNVQVKPYTPGYGWQSDILQRASLVVTNGGAGSILAAVSAGVPLVVVPAAWDKPENARRVVEAGVGIQVPPARCTPRRLQQAVSRVLGEPAYSANARHVGEALNQQGGAGHAAQLLERLANDHRHTLMGRTGGTRHAILS